MLSGPMWDCPQDHLKDCDVDGDTAGLDKVMPFPIHGTQHQGLVSQEAPTHAAQNLSQALSCELGFRSGPVCCKILAGKSKVLGALPVLVLAHCVSLCYRCTRLVCSSTGGNS